MGIENLAIFIGTGILLNLYPGPDTFYIIGRSLSQGRGAGICAALGNQYGGSGTYAARSLRTFCNSCHVGLGFYCIEVSRCCLPDLSGSSADL